MYPQTLTIDRQILTILSAFRLQLKPDLISLTDGQR